MKFPTDNILNNWLEKNGDPETERFVSRNLAVTEKVCSILKEKGIKKKEFAKMLGKTPSEVSKWLTGAHNLTLKSITKMEIALEVDLINIEPVKEVQYVYLGKIHGGGLYDAINGYEKTYYDSAIA